MPFATSANFVTGRVTRPLVVLVGLGLTYTVIRDGDPRGANRHPVDQLIPNPRPPISQTINLAEL
jgi:hypothetical protein